MPNKIKAVLILGTAALIIIIAALVSVMKTNTAAFRVVKLSDVKGSAVVLHGKRETEAYAGMNLESKDTVSVGKDSSVTLLLDNDTYVILDAQTTVTLEATGSSDNSITDIRLVSGTVLNEICSPLSEKSSYTVSAPGMSMKVRGTSFSVSCFKYSEEAYLTELNTYHGSVAVSLFDESGNEKGSEVYVDEGKTVTVVTEGTDPVNKGSASFIYPTGDAENPFYYCSEEDDPTYLSSYFYIPSSVRERVLASDANKKITLSDDVRDRLSGIMPPDSLVTAAPTAETQPDETSVPDESTALPDDKDTVINSDTEEETEAETEAEAETEDIEESKNEQPAETTRPAFTLSPVAVFTTVAGPSPSVYTTTAPPQITTVPISLTVITTTTTEEQGEFEIEYLTETAAHTTTYEQPEDDAEATDPWYLRPTVTTTKYVSEITETTSRKPVTTASTTFRQVTNATTTTENRTEPVTTEVTTVPDTSEVTTQTTLTEPVTVPTTASSAETTPSSETGPDPVPDPTAPPEE